MPRSEPRRRASLASRDAEVAARRPHLRQHRASARRTARTARRSTRCASMSKSSVRDAFVGSVAWTAPPVSCQTSQVSIVPTASSLGAYRSSKRVLAKQPLDLRRREVRIEDEPVRSAIHSRARRELRRSAPPCGGPARRSRGARGLPVARSQMTTVSRWFVMPIGDGRLARCVDRLARGDAHALENLLGVVLDPARLREILRDLAISAAGDASVFADHQAGRRRSCLRRSRGRISSAL